MAAMLPTIEGALMFWRGLHYQEPDPGPGNMPSWLPAAGITMVFAGIVFVWSLPQVLLLIPLWRGRKWAFMTISILLITQGLATPLVAIFVLSRGSSQWCLGAYSVFSIVCGGLLAIAKMGK